MGNNNGLTKRRILAGLDTLCVHNRQQHNPSYTGFSWKLFSIPSTHPYLFKVKIVTRTLSSTSFMQKGKWVGPAINTVSGTQNLRFGGLSKARLLNPIRKPRAVTDVSLERRRHNLGKDGHSLSQQSDILAKMRGKGSRRQ